MLRVTSAILVFKIKLMIDGRCQKHCIAVNIVDSVPDYLFLFSFFFYFFIFGYPAAI